MVAPPAKTHRAFVKAQPAASTWPTCATRMATRFAACSARRNKNFQGLNPIFKTHQLRGLMEVNRVLVFDTGTRMGTSLRRAGPMTQHGVPAKPPVANTAGGSFFGRLQFSSVALLRLPRQALKGRRELFQMQSGSGGCCKTFPVSCTGTIN